MQALDRPPGRTAEHLGIDPGLPLDEQVRHAQLIKLREEIKGLRSAKWSFDNMAKLVISFLAVITAVWAFRLGLPQAKMEAYEAKEKLDATRKDLGEKTDALLLAANRLQELEGQRKASQESIEDLQKVKSATAAEVKELQDLLAKLRIDDPALLKQAERAARQPVFVQFAGAVQRSTIDGLRARLVQAGFSAPPAVRRYTGQNNEIRYLDTVRNGEAIALAARTAVVEHFAAAGCPIVPPEIKKITGVNAGGTPVEILLEHSCKK